MPNFSKSSLDKLKTCDKRIQEVCFELIKYFDFTVLCGHRGKEEQDLAFKEGRSKLKFPQSKHNKYSSQAIDICPYPIDWNDIRRFTYMAGMFVGIASIKGIKVRWGGDWDKDTDLKDNKFNDLPHFELVI